MADKVGTLIKEARKAAGLTQEKLAKKVGGGLTAADIGKAERGELSLSVAVLRKIAKATGVTQASLVNAAKGTAKPAAKPAASSAAKPAAASSATTSMRLTAAEKQLVTWYRKADKDTKKAALNVLKGKCSDLVPTLADAGTSTSPQAQGSVADLLSGALESLLGGK